MRRATAGRYVQSAGEAGKITCEPDIADNPPDEIRCRAGGQRKEEAKKISQLKASYGGGICYLVFLCGYFDSGYLGYEAADGIDWIWEHRINDFDQLGL